MVFSPKLVMLTNTAMKILKSLPISPFGGLNFLLEEFDKLGLDKIIQQELPELSKQSKYTWKDILYSFWSIYFCGGDCIEDLSIHLKEAINTNPYIHVPSPDRVLERMKELSFPMQVCHTIRGDKRHEFSINELMNTLNINLLKKISNIQNKKNILDYDNTIIYTEKADATMTYKRKTGYQPGVGIIGKNIVYLENRNGNSDAQTLQQDTLKRMFDLLKSHGIDIDVFRADSASYQLSTLSVITRNVNRFFIRGRMNQSLHEAINQIDKWDETIIDNKVVYRGETNFIPFEKIAKRTRQQHLLESYRLIVTKEKRVDGQTNIFTGEAFNYSAIITNDYEMTADQAVIFYNQRGTAEIEFDIMKNDFGWNNMPFSRIQYNTVFLILTAICRNIYNYIICSFSKVYKYLSPSFRIKKFIFRFVCIPAKWMKTSRMWKLRVYGNLYFKT